MFTHLHCHSFFSFNAGTIREDVLPLLAKETGMTSLAITDTNNMSGAIPFYFAAKKVGIKPILGVELKTRHEKLVLLAKNNEGYREICEIVTNVLASIPQTKPKLTLEDVYEQPVNEYTETGRRKTEDIVIDEKYYPLAPFVEQSSENIFILSSSPTVLRSLASRQREVFIEIIPAERRAWKLLREIYRDYKLPLVATNDVMLRRPEDFDLHKLLRAIGSNTTIGNTPQNELSHPSQYFTNEQEYRALAGPISEECYHNIDRIAEECSIEFDGKKSKFAKFDTPDPNALLRELADEGFRRRYPNPTLEHTERFESELKMIEDRNATSYFLATHDMVLYAKSKNYPYMGRGSGANSLIAYTLDMSNVDPIANNLRFERFLNPERESSPDFDMDFSWRDRYEVIHYMLNKYNKVDEENERSAGNAAMLCTIQRYRNKASIREIGKALGYTEAEINERIADVRSVSHTGEETSNRGSANRGPGSGDRGPGDAKGKNSGSRNGSSQTHLNKKPPLLSEERVGVKSVTEEKSLTSDLDNWTSWSNRLLDFPRHLSVHAGGIIIGDKSLYHYTPLQQSPIGVPISQIDMHGAEDLGLVKLDILATRGLGTYWDTMALVEKRYGVRPPVEDERVAFRDEPTRKIIRTGKTKGCFYIESPAMIGLLRKLRTDTFENLTAASSVIRPGVAQSGMMQEFIRRHRNPGQRQHIHPKLGELMKETYGIMVYQEDVLNVVHELAGLSYAEADIFRRSMSGKLRSHERIAPMRDKFVQGCLDKGISTKVAEEVWRQIYSFAGFSFCKAHSASYAVLSFQEAWLKVHYPTEFLCSVLNNFGGYYNHQEYINEAKHLGITVRIPDVNMSELRHIVEEDNVIRLGLYAFKGISDNSIQNLLNNRDKSGPYTSIEDFTLRSGVTPEDGRNLIKLGACNSIAESRSIAGLTFNLLSAPGKSKPGQHSLAFPKESLSYDLSHLSESSTLTIFNRERKFLNYAVTNSPNDFLDCYRQGSVRSIDLADHVGQIVTIVGYRSASKTVRTRLGKLMLMLNVSDHHGMMDVVIWNEVYVKCYTALTAHSAFRITGKVTESFDVVTLEAISIEGLNFAEQGMDQ